MNIRTEYKKLVSLECYIESEEIVPDFAFAVVNCPPVSAVSTPIPHKDDIVKSLSTIEKSKR